MKGRIEIETMAAAAGFVPSCLYEYDDCSTGGEQEERKREKRKEKERKERKGLRALKTFSSKKIGEEKTFSSFPVEWEEEKKKKSVSKKSLKKSAAFSFCDKFSS